MKIFYKYLLFVLSATFILVGCVNQGEVKQTYEDNDIAQAHTSTQQPTTATTPLPIYSPTVIQTQTSTASPTEPPTPTPTTTPKLPVAHDENFPGKPISLNAANIKDIELIGTFGEGLHYSTHYNEELGQLLLVYSTGIDVFQEEAGFFSHERSFDFDIQIMDFAYYESGDLYHVSASTRYFVQDFGTRFSVLNLITGEQQGYLLNDEGTSNWISYIRKPIFSSQEDYLILTGSNEFILLDLNSMEEVFHGDGRGFFSEDGDYLLSVRDKQVDIYQLPTLELINSVHGTEFSQFATITHDQRLITVFANVVMVYSFPEHQFLGLIYAGGRSNFIYSRYQDVTSTGEFLITADFDEVRIWNLIDFEYVAAFYDSYNFELSPDETHLYIIGKTNIMVNLADSKPVASFDFSANVHTKFTDDNQYFIAHAGNGTWVYDFKNQKTIPVYIYDEDQPGYGRFFGASGQYLWMYIDYYDIPVEFYRYDLLSGEKEPFDEGILEYANLDFYSDDFQIIFKGDDAEVRRMEDMSLINKLTPFRKSGRSYIQSLRDYSQSQWYGESPIVLNSFASSVKWDVDYDQLSQAFYYVTSRVSYNQFKLYIKNIESPDGKYRVQLGDYYSEDRGKVLVYLTEDDSLLRKFSVVYEVSDWAFSPDSNIIYISASGKDPMSAEWIGAFDISNNQLIRQIEYKAVIKSGRSTQYLYAIPVAISPDGRYLATGNATGQIQVIDLDQYWSVSYTLDAILDNYSDIQFSPDGSYLATATGDDRVQFWKADTGELIWTWDVLDSYDLGINRMIQFYLMDNLIIVMGKADPWGRFGQIKVYGILEK